jgi:hypothetical protein
MPKRKQGYERGLGHYSQARNPEQHKSRDYDKSGNPVEPKRQLSQSKLDEAAATRKGLPKNAR